MSANRGEDLRARTTSDIKSVAPLSRDRQPSVKAAKAVLTETEKLTEKLSWETMTQLAVGVTPLMGTVQALLSTVEETSAVATAPMTESAASAVRSLSVAPGATRATAVAAATAAVVVAAAVRQGEARLRELTVDPRGIRGRVTVVAGGGDCDKLGSPTSDSTGGGGKASSVGASVPATAASNGLGEGGALGDVLG